MYAVHYDWKLCSILAQHEAELLTKMDAASTHRFQCVFDLISHEVWMRQKPSEEFPSESAHMTMQ